LLTFTPGPIPSSKTSNKQALDKPQPHGASDIKSASFSSSKRETISSSIWGNGFLNFILPVAINSKEAGAVTSLFHCLAI